MENRNTKWNPKRIAALLAVILLVGLYVVTLLVAIFAPTEGSNLFAVCLMATIAVPLLAWVYIWLYGQMTGKKTMADLNLMQGEADAAEEAEAEAEADDAGEAEAEETAGNAEE